MIQNHFGSLGNLKGFLNNKETFLRGSRGKREGSPERTKMVLFRTVLIDITTFWENIPKYFAQGCNT